MLGKINAYVKATIIKTTMGKMPCTIFGAFKLFGVHEYNDVCLGLNSLDILAHT